MTTDDVAEVLHIHRRTVYNWIKAKRLKASKPEGIKSWIISKEDFLRFTKNRT